MYLNSRLLYNKYLKMTTLPFTIIIPGCAPHTNFQCDNGIYHIDI